ncbi:hypothetical protein Tco_1010310, partial [Tanacetum coccineum]
FFKRLIQTEADWEELLLNHGPNVEEMVNADGRIVDS